MTPDLANRLTELADLATRGELPDSAVAVLGRAVRRAEACYWLGVAAGHAGGVAGLVAALRRDGWRLQHWRRRGGPPVSATPLQAAAYNALELAGNLPSERHLRRLCRGQEMADDTAETPPEFSGDHP